MYQILPKLSIKLTLAFYFVNIFIYDFLYPRQKKMIPNTARSLENYFWNHIKYVFT